jgi:hypothetical protein
MFRRSAEHSTHHRPSRSNSAHSRVVVYKKVDLVVSYVSRQVLELVSTRCQSGVVQMEPRLPWSTESRAAFETATPNGYPSISEVTTCHYWHVSAL